MFLILRQYKGSTKVSAEPNLLQKKFSYVKYTYEANFPIEKLKKMSYCDISGFHSTYSSFFKFVR